MGGGGGGYEERKGREGGAGGFVTLEKGNAFDMFDVGEEEGRTKAQNTH